jgi:D-glycerate 3-kinase
MTRANLLRLRLTIGEALHRQLGALCELRMAETKNGDESLRNAGEIPFSVSLTNLVKYFDPSYTGVVRRGQLNQQERDILESGLLRFGRAFGISRENIDSVLDRTLKTYRDAREGLERYRLEKRISENLDSQYFRFYVPLAWWVADRVAEKKRRFPNQAYGLAINGGQGTGKTTKAGFLKVILEILGYKVVTFSTDDFYKTHEELQKLKQRNPVYKSRGPPGTHDIKKLKEVMDALKNRKATKIPRYDKSAFNGEGDREPEEKWEVVPEGIDIFIMEGAQAGLRPILSREDLYKPTIDKTLNKNELKYDPTGLYRETFNEATKEYVQISNLFDNLVLLDVSLRVIRKGRMEQEAKMIQEKKKGMDPEALKEFIDYYSLFLRIIRNLADSEYPDLVVKIGYNLRILKVS